MGKSRAVEAVATSVGTTSSVDVELAGLGRVLLRRAKPGRQPHRRNRAFRLSTVCYRRRDEPPAECDPADLVGRSVHRPGSEPRDWTIGDGKSDTYDAAQWSFKFKREQRFRGSAEDRRYLGFYSYE